VKLLDLSLVNITMMPAEHPSLFLFRPRVLARKASQFTLHNEQTALPFITTPVAEPLTQVLLLTGRRNPFPCSSQGRYFHVCI
jgi:hypothetical protein